MSSPGTIRFVEVNTVPSAPPAGSALIYVKTDNVIYLQDSDGNEVPLGTASGITSLSGEATGTGPGSAVVTLSNSAVIGKVLTGFTSGPNSTVLSTDTLLQAIQKLQAQISAASGSAITSLTGDVSASGPGAASSTVNSVGGKTASAIASAVTDVEAATSINTASTIVERDASGNFAANIITATLAGNASTATTATNFSGSLSGDVTGTQSATVVSSVGGKTAAAVASAVDDVQAATSLNTASAIVERDASGNFSANQINANLTGNVTGSASNNVLKSGDTMTGPLLNSNTTQSTSKDTGSVILEGGLGVEKNINAGGTILGSNISGSTSGTNTGDVTVTDSNTVDLTLSGQDVSASVRISDATLTSDVNGLKVGTVPAVQVSGLATVATSGAYSDLSGAPSSLPPSGTAGGDLSGSYPNPNLSTTKQNFLLDRANHTGTQSSSTISDFSEAAQDSVGSILTDTATIDFTYNDAANTISAIVVDSSITDAKIAAGVDALKIGAGTVSNTEFGYLDGVTSSIQTQLNSVSGDASAAQADIDNHIADTTDAHDASAISSVPSGNLAATDVQSALDELQSDIDTRATSAALTAHTGNTSNPHSTTKAQVGLGNVLNVDTTTTANISDSLDKRFVTDADLVTISNQSGVNTGDQDLSGLVPKTTTVNGYALSANVTLTKTDIGLGNVDNTSDLNKPISTATQTALNAKENSITAGTTSQYFRGDKTFQTLDKAAVGLGNVDNTSDVNKPVSTAQAAADAAVQAYSIQRANHTGTQAPSTIVQDASNRFTTDAEKATWNAKQNALGYTPANESLSNLADVAINATLLPDTDGVYDLGASGQNWNAIRAKTIGYDGATAINLDSRKMYDVAAVESVDFESRILKDATGANAADYNSRLLFDDSAIKSVDWLDRGLYGVDGTTKHLDWSGAGVRFGTDVEIDAYLRIFGNNGVEFSGVQVNNTNLAGYCTISARADDGEVVQIGALNSLGAANAYGIWQPTQFGLYAKRTLNIITDTAGAEIRFATDTGAAEVAKIDSTGKFHSKGVNLTTGTVENVPTPVADTDAANKQYADRQSIINALIFG